MGVENHSSLADLDAVLARVAPSAVRAQHPDRVRVECAGGLVYDARVVGTDTGREAWSFTSSLGRVEAFEDRFPLAKLLACVATTAAVRAVVDGHAVLLETRVAPGDLRPDRVDESLRWRLSEFCAAALAWRRRLGLAPEEPPARSVTTLHDLVRATPVPTQKALLVAAVGFAVAGADGRLSGRERARLSSWLREVPSFAGLDESRVLGAVATLASDSARTLFEARRHLDMRERLLAWALANDMAHAEGFTSAEERRYLTSVASIFELSAREMDPFLEDAQSRAVRTETTAPPAILEG